MATDADILRAIDSGRSLLMSETGAVSDDDAAPILVRAAVSVIVPGHDPSTDSPLGASRWDEFWLLARDWLALHMRSAEAALPESRHLSFHVDRLSALAADLLTSAPLAPPLRLPVEPLDLHGIAGAVVFSNLRHAHHELWPLMVDGLAYGTILGVHDSWLHDGAATRALTCDPVANRLIEANLSAPMPLRDVLLLIGPEATEMDWHRAVSGDLQNAGTGLLNPYEASALADDKWECGARMEFAGVPVPETRLVKQGGADIPEQFLEYCLGETGRVVVKPSHGTAARGVTITSDAGEARAAIARIVAEDDALIQQYVGGLRYADNVSDALPAVIRLHAICGPGGRYRVESGYVHVARMQDSDVVSIAKGGHARPVVAECLHVGSKRFGPGERDRMMEAARLAAETIATDGVPRLFGIDVTMDETGDAYVLDVNPRPAGLIHSRYLAKDWAVVGEPGVSMRLWRSEGT